jgi:hypothetical protein
MRFRRQLTMGVAPAKMGGNEEMTTDLLNYGRRLEEAGLGIVKAVMEQVAAEGLPGDHHFYLTFDTDHPGVEIADRLRAKYPGEMTVVLQHRYDNLQVDDSGFEVGLNFSSMPYRLCVPWGALRRFVDPAASFGLEFPAPGSRDKDRRSSGPRAVEPLPDRQPSSDEETSDAASGQGPHRLSTPSPAALEPTEDPAAAQPAATESEVGATDPEAETAKLSPRPDGVVRLDDFRKR